MRSNGLPISWTKLGSGSVILDDPVESLLPRDTRTMAPPTPRTENCQLIYGLVQPRPGYTAYHTKPDSEPVLGLYLAHFDDGSTELIRAAQTKLYADNGSAFIAITPTVAPTGDTDDPWYFAMVRRAGGTTKVKQLLMSNGVDAVIRYLGGGIQSDYVMSATIKGPMALLGHRGRGLYANVYDVGLATRKNQRVYYSIVGDPLTLTGFGSGFVDLDDDQYPIVALANIAGNVCAFKGDVIGGSIVVGTPTGVSQAPYRWDTINTNGIGVLCPRTLTQITPDLYFFVGQDGFYLYDGARGILPVATESSKTIIRSINPSAVQLAHAYYVPATKEVILHLPTGTSTYPDTAWVFNVLERRLYGPYIYGTRITAASALASTGTLTWLSLGVYGTWSNLPFPTWNSIGLPPATRTSILGDSTGFTYQEDGVTSTDNGAAFIAVYTSPVLIPHELQTAAGQPLDPCSSLTIQDVILSYKDVGTWTPIVEVSIDGMNFTVISDGIAVGTGSGRIMSKTYSCVLASSWFQFRVSSASPNMKLWGITLDTTPSGKEMANQ